MTDEHQQPPEQSMEPAKAGKGKGCVFGGLAVLAASLAGIIASGIIAALVPDSAAGLAGLAAFGVWAGLLVWAGIHWKATPGFLLGIGLSFAIPIAILTACTAAVLVFVSIDSL
jgi:hypothetical protein